ncbi:MAG: class I SAM-dependent methyltransferase [Brevinematales bacterium]
MTEISPLNYKYGSRFLKKKFDILEKYAVGKVVLDCGCVGDPDDPDWIHGKLYKIAKKVVGVDINKGGIKKLRRKGYNVIYGNVETINLHKKFDVIFAGSLIEHIENQGLFLKNVERHLKKNGVLILTTPAISHIGYLLDTLRARWSKKYELSHNLHFHTFDTLWALLHRHGFSVIDFYWWMGGKFRGIMKLLINLFGNIFPPVFVGHMIFVAKKTASSQFT